MHIFFSGIDGSGIGSLSLIALKLGYEVSGSDKSDTNSIKYLRNKGITNISIIQSYETIASIHAKKTIDWFVYSSAVAIEHPDSEELQFCKDKNIKATKRDQLINYILKEKQLELISIAGTHGKSTTTAMTIWLFKSLSIPISYSVGANISFGDIGTYDRNSNYFVYEADEYDRNFLSFNSHICTITGINWDHPDTYPTEEIYLEAFRNFVQQSLHTMVWKSDREQIDIQTSKDILILDDDDFYLDLISLVGQVNRRNAWQAIQLVHYLTNVSLRKLIEYINQFPGLSRRFEQIRPNLYTDYAHTSSKIRGALQIAYEMSGENVIVVYEGHQNTRQHFMKEDLRHLFDDVKHIYIVPTYLTREDKDLEILTPDKLRNLLDSQIQTKTTVRILDVELKICIQHALDNGECVLCLSAGNANSLDEWLRKEFA